ncbi:MAG TPA: hypothetical protein VK178_01620 [Opitutaceae bacterium]|nr:hypothetical protein [Opitutaceae bacterium]
MDQDHEHLRLLTIFHYVVAGIAALFACFPLIHLAVGLFFILAPASMTGSGQPPPPAFLGWIFVIFASCFILAGWTFAACVLYAGRCLAKRRRLLFCQVMAGVECMFMPFGTALGVFTLLVLTRPSVKPLFDDQRPTPRLG